MEKPDTIRFREFGENIRNCINEAQLPAFVLIPVVRSILDQLTEIDNKKYADDMRQYHAAQEGQSQENNTND